MSRHFAYRSYQRRFVRPLRTAHGEWSEREGFIVRIEDEGRVGFGEIAPIPWFGTETVTAARAFLEEWTRDPEIAEDPERMGQLPCCAFGISAALAELEAEDVEIPRWPVAILLPAGAGVMEVIQAKQQSTETERRGYKNDAAAPCCRGVCSDVYKWKIGVEDLEVELQLLDQLLSQLRDGERLRLDANGGLDTVGLTAWLERLSQHLEQIEYLEQPLPVGQEAMMAEFMARSGVPIALDESLNGTDRAQWLAPGAWKGPLVIKSALMGDVTQLLGRLKPVAKQVVLSSVFETAVGRRNTLRLVDALPEMHYALGFDTQEAFEDSLGKGDVWSNLVGSSRRGDRSASEGEGLSLLFGQANPSGERSSRREDPTFEKRIESHKTKLQALAQPERGVLIAERDPIEFTLTFLAAVQLEIPVVLANPNWGEQEWSELGQLVSPAILNNNIPLKEYTNESICIPRASILIPTGGSSGGVKLAIHTWASLEASARGLQTFLGGGPIDSCCCLPLYHVSGLMQLVRAVVTGGTITFSEANPEGQCLSLVPTQLQRMLGGMTSRLLKHTAAQAVSSAEKENPVHTEVDPPFDQLEKLRSAKAIFVGGAPMSEALAEQARAAKLPLVPVYGMTETAAMVVAQSSEDFLSGGDYLCSTGRVLPHVKVDVLDEAGESCAPGVPGRICIQSESLFQGYWGRPLIDLSQGYLTDDEGVLDSEGRLTILGRIDRLILTGGEKVDPREVEAALLQCEGVREALVLGKADDEWGWRVCAYLVGDVVDANSLKLALKNRLASYKIPKEWNFVDNLPFDEKGKLRV